MNRVPCAALLALLLSGPLPAVENTTIKAFVDTDVCARLLLGPITEQRTACSAKAFKQGDQPVLVQLLDNTVFTLNKPKLVKEYVGKLAEATGEAKPKDGLFKLESVKPLEAASIPAGDPARRLLDVRAFKTVNGPELHEKIRRELAMMPYITEYDFISFNLNGPDVILTGFTVRNTNRSEAANRVKALPGVETVVNNIEVLPLGSFDMTIRAEARAKLQRFLPRYFWGNGSDIKIIVKDGVIILFGAVGSQSDADLARVQCLSVKGAFNVVNLLRVQAPKEKKS